MLQAAVRPIAMYCTKSGRCPQQPSPQECGGIQTCVKPRGQEVFVIHTRAVSNIRNHRINIIRTGSCHVLDRSYPEMHCWNRTAVRNMPPHKDVPEITHELIMHARSML
jgi:hypothetical protein